MMERPIIFSGAMVRAILEGRKTETRRAAKPQPSAGVRDSVFVRSGLEDGHGRELRCPYGQPGDRLWVRETFAYWSARDIFSGAPIPVTVYRAGRQWRNGNCPGYEKGELFWKSPDDKPADVKWKPSIHMPRWASRITLEITDVRVQRVQDISQMDVLDEGIDTEGDDYNEGERLQSAGSPVSAERFAFARLWDSINEKRGFGWNENPYVWALTFKRVEK